LTLALLGDLARFLAVLAATANGSARRRFSAISSPQSKQLP
jgi:hypothetical protein